MELKTKPKPKRTIYHMIYDSVPRVTHGGRDRKLAAIAKRVAAKRKGGRR